MKQIIVILTLLLIVGCTDAQMKETVDTKPVAVSEPEELSYTETWIKQGFGLSPSEYKVIGGLDDRSESGRGSDIKLNITINDKALRVRYYHVSSGQGGRLDHYCISTIDGISEYEKIKKFICEKNDIVELCASGEFEKITDETKTFSYSRTVKNYVDDETRTPTHRPGQFECEI